MKEARENNKIDYTKHGFDDLSNLCDIILRDFCISFEERTKHIEENEYFAKIVFGVALRLALKTIYALNKSNEENEEQIDYKNIFIKAIEDNIDKIHAVHRQ